MQKAAVKDFVDSQREKSTASVTAQGFLVLLGGEYNCFNVEMSLQVRCYDF